MPFKEGAENFETLGKPDWDSGVKQEKELQEKVEKEEKKRIF